MAIGTSGGRSRLGSGQMRPAKPGGIGSARRQDSASARPRGKSRIHSRPDQAVTPVGTSPPPLGPKDVGPKDW
jgi:hypothetical protein